MATSEKGNRLPIRVDDFGDFFPHMEDILQCGIFIHNSRSGEGKWSAGVFHILSADPNSVHCSFETFLNFVVPEDRELLRTEVNCARDQKPPNPLEFSIRDTKGQLKRVSTERILRKEQADKDIFEGFLKDVTESYQVREALEIKVKQLDTTNQSLQEFVYFASHDLQEPLRKISTFVGRLEQRFQAELPEEGRSYLSRILNATQNMQRLLEDLLTFSRLSFEDRSVETVNLNNCVRQAISDLELKIEDSGAQIFCSELPVIKGHPHQIKQLFLNLLSNAIKFRKAQAVPQIRVLCAKVSEPLLPDHSVLAGAFLELKIIDNGIGFEQLFAEKIFTIFQRLNGKAEYTGSGIGLAICRKIVENHGGKIYANSGIGLGATFTILLPYNY